MSREVPLRKVVGDPERMRGKRVLELGCRTGRMSCYFASIGADVLGVDVAGCDLEPARQLARRLSLPNVTFRNFSGELDTLPQSQWDFVFSKSVLVVLDVKWASAAIRRLLKPGGEYLACENLTLPFLLNCLRPHRHRGLTSQDLRLLKETFGQVELSRHMGLVAAIRARVVSSLS